jgi:hypothetical protein
MKGLNAKFIRSLIAKKDKNGRTVKGFRFTMTYRRADGTFGTGCFRFGIKQKNKPQKTKTPEEVKASQEAGYITVWNCTKKEYRRITIANIVEIKFGSTVMNMATICHALFLQNYASEMAETVQSNEVTQTVQEAA